MLGDSQASWLHYVSYGRRMGFSPNGLGADLGKAPVFERGSGRLLAMLDSVTLDLSRTLLSLRERRPPAQTAYLTIETPYAAWSYDLLPLAFGNAGEVSRGARPVGPFIATSGVEIALKDVCRSISDYLASTGTGRCPSSPSAEGSSV